MASQAGDNDHMSISSDLMESTYLVDQTDVASQRSTTTAGGNSSLRDGPRLMVYVTLGNGERLLVPIPERATVQDLQFAALRRAERLGITATLAETVIRTVGSHAAVIDGDDLVQDFMDLTHDRTFSLEVLNPTMSGTTQVTTSSVSLPILPTVLDQRTSQPSFANRNVYIRWITTQGVIDVSRLDTLPVDPVPLDANTSLSEVQDIAVQRLCHGQPTLSTTSATRVKLWLKECPLATKDNLATLADLGLSGTAREPLDIFVQLLGVQERKSLSQVSETMTPQAAWGFNTTLRGISTFVTSLSILLEEIEKGEVEVETVLDALLEVTHFPPAVLAFQAVYDKGLGYGSNADVGSVLLLADLFNSVCKSMVPDWICGSNESKLEGSRQILSWFYTLCVGSKQLAAPQCVYQIQVFRPPTGDVADPTSGAIFSHTEVIQLSTSVSEQTTTAASETTIVVSIEGPGGRLTRRLAFAHNCKSPAQHRWEYYFHRTEEWSDFIGRPALHRPGPADFDNLLTDANVYLTFKMIDPMQLGACLSTELPVITLSGKGYVSLYDQEDIACGEREFYMHNVVEGKVKMDKTDPGQSISQQLESVILKRKKQGSWEVDAWSEWLETANHGEPDESIVICIDTSSSMNMKMHDDWNTRQDGLGQTESRLHEVKEFFHQFSTRLSSYSLSTNVGLVTFSGVGKVNVVQPLTMLQLDFRDKLAAVNASGSTAIFNALSLANAMLTTQKASFPKTKCRIILLTDGEDNNSNVFASHIANTLHDNDIVLDSIVIGSDKTVELFKISRSTGGYAFHPQTQQIFFQIFLLETFIDIRTRPDIKKFPTGSQWIAFQPKEADMRDAFSFPPCRPHPNQEDYFISLGNAHKFLRRKTAKSGGYSSVASTTSTLRSSRTFTTGGPRILLSEVKAMIDNAHPRMDVYVSQSNIGFWKVIMEGPEGSPYETGTFLLYVDIGNDFPRTPPAVRFITHILHPNISKHGRVCHPIFDREWSPLIHVYEVLQHIFGMLMSLESRDAIDPISALKFYTDPEEGQRQVSAYIQRFATQRREYLATTIVNGGAPSSSASSIVRSEAGGSSATVNPWETSSPTSAPSHLRPSSRQTIRTTGVPDAPSRGFGTDSAGSSMGAATSSTLPPAQQSSLAQYLATRRGTNRDHSQSVSSANQGRVPPPPLMTRPEEATGQSVMASSTHSLPLTASNLAAVPGPLAQRQAIPSGNQSSVGGSEAGTRRVSRRASFFSKLRRVGN